MTTAAPEELATTYFGEVWIPPAGEALCAEIDPDAWFPEKGAAGQTSLAEVRAVCLRCPLLSECRAWGIAHPYEHGIWGGLSPRQRQAAYRRQHGSQRTREAA